MIDRVQERILNLTIYATLAALIAIDEFYGIGYAGNLAIFAAWFFIVVGFIALSVEPDKLFSDTKHYVLAGVPRYAVIAFMIAIGWTVTGTFYFLVTVLHYVKYLVYKDGQTTQPGE